MVEFSVRTPGITPTPQGDASGMTLMEHLVELRRRMVKAVLALVIGTIVALFFTGELLLFLQSPYGREFAVLGPTSGITAYFRVALMAGAALAIPIITYQGLMFILPGLTHSERRWVLGALLPLTLLFVVGVAFTWWVLIPPALGFLEGFESGLFRAEWTADLYLSFVTTLLFWMGVAFEMPLVFFVLALLGVVRARLLVQHWRIAIIGAVAIAALITPTTDPFNLMLVTLPLLALYLLSIGFTLLGQRLSGNVSE